MAPDMVYLDNAATSFPKPHAVLETTCRAIFSPLGNPGRSSHKPGRNSAELVFSAREHLALLLGLEKSDRLVFTGGATEGLNMAICGAVESAKKFTPIPLVISSVFEHNSVLRPLFRLEEKGEIRLKILSPLKDGSFSPRDLLSPPPNILVLTLRSNVTGRTFPLPAIKKLLEPYGTLIIGDGAQAVGSEKIHLEKCGVHILCAPSHKGLFGMMGAGFIAFSENCPFLPEPVITGGSGTDSFSEKMPDYLPERLEAGTLPVPAIVSMGEGAKYLLSVGQEKIEKLETERKEYLIRGLRSLSGFTLYEPFFSKGPLLINREGIPSEKAAEILSEKGLCVRGGFHCAPLAHRYLGTEETGAIRLSPGPFTTKEELDFALAALNELAKEKNR